MNSKNPDPDRIVCNTATAAQILGEYGDFIKRVIYSQVQDEDLAGDMFQDFFLSLICNPLPGDIENIEASLQRAIANDVVDVIRKKKIYLNCLYEYAEFCNCLTSQKIPEKVAQETEEKNRVFELVEKQLPRTEAQALRLKYRDGLDTKEIAEKMKVKSKTNRGYVHDGLNRIRRLLKDIQAREKE